MKQLIALSKKLYGWLIHCANLLQSPLLLAIRLYWGYQFFMAGKGKLMDISKPAGYFKDLGIPFPHEQAILVGCVECFGGLLLLVGLASRLVSIPLSFTLIVAYFTADLDVTKNIFNDPDKFVSAAEFLFLFAAVLILSFGPGVFSLDYLLGRMLHLRSTPSTREPAVPPAA